MSSEAVVNTQPQAEERHQQEASIVTAETEVMQAIALLRSKGYAVEAQEKEVEHDSPADDIVSVASDCDYAQHGTNTPTEWSCPRTLLDGTPATDAQEGL
eukprot:1093720-Amphidinium_carterae.1